MPIWLRNFQSRVIFNVPMFKMHCYFLLNAFGVSRYDVSVVCVDNRYIQYLNKTYRQKDTPTDILSFPYYEDLKPGSLPAEPLQQDDFNLGDIILGLPHIVDQLYDTSLQQHLPVLVTHGLCHLLGYRHDTPTKTQMMYRREKSVLSAFNNAFGTCLKPLTTVELFFSNAQNI